MKVLKKFYIITLLSAGLFLMALSFSGTAVAQQPAEKDCVSSCVAEKQMCINITGDKPQCEKECQACVAACKSKAAPPSPSQTEQKSGNLTPTLY
jgi:hypothetical protein